MSIELLKTELGRAEDAELASDEQVRQLTALIDKASTPNASLCASDCAKLVTSALALNDRLRDRVVKLRITLSAAQQRQPAGSPRTA